MKCEKCGKNRYSIGLYDPRANPKSFCGCDHALQAPDPDDPPTREQRIDELVGLWDAIELAVLRFEGEPQTGVNHKAAATAAIFNAMVREEQR